MYTQINNFFTINIIFHIYVVYENNLRFPKKSVSPTENSIYTFSKEYMYFLTIKKLDIINSSP